MRYLVLVAGVVAILIALARLKAGTIGRPGHVAGAVFTGLLDLQVLLGIGVMLTRPFYPALIGHITMMVLAVVVAHVTAVILRRRPPERRSPVIQLVGFLLALVFVIGGIRAIGRSVLDRTYGFGLDVDDVRDYVLAGFAAELVHNVA